MSFTEGWKETLNERDAGNSNSCSHLSKMTGGFTSGEAACTASCILSKVSESGKCIKDVCVCS